MVYDADFGVPLAGARVEIVDTRQIIATSEDGNFLFPQVAPGTYTLSVSKEGFVRQVKTGVVVTAGGLTEFEASLAGEFTEMDEIVVQDILQISTGNEAGLLKLRFESASLMDSVSSDLMSRAGASDAASALRLVSGATVQDDKSAVIRGLPDRYVSSQMNGVRLPSADEDKRAVELDQFPASVINSIQVSKTFTPDQQGDASGGAVDVRLKGIPDQTTFQFSAQLSHNTNVGSTDFLSYDGGGVEFWADDDGGRDIQPVTDPPGNWNGAVGVSEIDAPTDFKWSGSYGTQHVFDDGSKLGGFVGLFYERDSASYDDGINDSYVVPPPAGGPLTPEIDGILNDGDFTTALFDVQQSKQSVQWGGLGTFGYESDDHTLGLTYLYTRVAEDTATLAIDTRGKEYFFPGYDVDDPSHPGNQSPQAAPYLRLETLEYTERTTGTLQLTGKHKLPIDDFEVSSFSFLQPELDWTIAKSFANMYQPDKRSFGAQWRPELGTPGLWLPYKSEALFTYGNANRTWKEIQEDSDQYALNLTLPFEQWENEKGYLKLGVFDDRVGRTFDQDSFSNFGDFSASYTGAWDDPWSDVFPSEDHAISDGPPFLDVDYDGNQAITAWYSMADLPLTSKVNLIGGARVERTEIGVALDAEDDATWVAPGDSSPTGLDPGEGDVDFEQDDLLPSLGLVYKATDKVTVRASYSQTVARQTFKELTPILQQEYLGAPIFVGNPDLQMSSLDNYDLRIDYVPREGSLLSASVFHKTVEDAIEYVQQYATFTYTTAVNYPSGKLSGLELEGRQNLEHWWKPLEGVAFGANATFIESEVDLPADEILDFANPSIQVPTTTRDMTNAPEHLYNLYVTYDLRSTGTQLALFYTLQGDTLVAGAEASNNGYVPDVYAKQYDTLNFSVTQALGQHLKLQFQAKNLTNPEIEEVYRQEDVIGDDVTKTSYTKGIEYSITLGVQFAF